MGPELREVPDLKGKSLREVKLKLANNRLKLGKISLASENNAIAGTVLSQTPESGRKVRKGTAIDIVVNKGNEPPINMPNLVGKKLSEIKEKINASGLLIGTVTMIWNEEIPRGEIVYQSIEAGKTIDYGSVLNLNVSAGTSWGGTALKQQNINYTVPAGRGRSEIKIILNDDFGSTVLYRGTHREADDIELLVNSFGDSEIVIYINDKIEKRFRI